MPKQQIQAPISGGKPPTPEMSASEEDRLAKDNVVVEHTGKCLIVKRLGVLAKVCRLELVLGVGWFPSQILMTGELRHFSCKWMRSTSGIAINLGQVPLSSRPALGTPPPYPIRLEFWTGTKAIWQFTELPHRFIKMLCLQISWSFGQLPCPVSVQQCFPSRLFPVLPCSCVWKSILECGQQLADPQKTKRVHHPWSQCSAFAGPKPQ